MYIGIKKQNIVPILFASTVLTLTAIPIHVEINFENWLRIDSLLK